MQIMQIVQDLLADPMGQSAAVPFVVALAGTVLIRFLAGPGSGAVAAGAAIVLGFVAAHIVIFGLPALPPNGASQKVFYIAVGAVLFGLIVDVTQPPDGVARLVAVIAIAAAIAWLLGPQVSLRNPVALVWPGGLILAAWLAVYGRLEALRGEMLTAPVMILVASVTLAAVGFYGHTASGSQLAAALAASAGGYVLANWPVVRMPVGMAVVASSAVPLALATQFVLFTKTSPVALVLILPIFVADRLAARLTPGSGPIADALEPIVLTLVCLVPAALAVWVAYYAAGGGAFGF
jgi:hypothetical protein